VEFSGPHPAGLPGTHIHYLDPVAADQSVWHIAYQDVITIGHLFKTGRLLTERVVSVAGPGAVKPRLLRTRPGASITELLAGEVVPQRNCRVISGSVLGGFAAEGPMAFLGRYDNQVSVIVEQAERRLFGWFGSGSDKYSFASPFASARGQGRLREITTARNGRRAAMIPVGAFERVMPLDILPVPLLRALLVKDTDSAQALGCLELAEEDLALTSFVCPSKQDYGAALRINLDQIEKEG
jgi:Na+-transporting NADH:ubiquinone oxidoreductase subunit A